MQRLAPIVLVGILALLYRPALEYDFVNADDSDLIAANQAFLRDWANLPQAFRQSYFETAGALSSLKSYYRPIVIVSFMLDSARGGADAGPFHLTNLALHVAVVLLLSLFLRRLGVSRGRALLLCSLFALHPVATSVVAWVPGRNDSLLALWLVAAVLALDGWRRWPTVAYGALHVFFFALALLTKEAAAAAPLVFAAFLWTRIGDGAAPRASSRGRRSPSARAMVWLGAADLFAIIGWGVLRQRALAGSADEGTLLAALSSGMATLWANLSHVPLAAAKVVAPIRVGTMPAADGWDLALGFVGLAAGAAVVWSLTVPRAALVVAWVAAFFAPSLVVPDLPAYEHRIYVPLIGVALGLAWWLEAERRPRSWRGHVLLVGLAAAFAVRVALYLPVFESPIAYWTAGTARMPYAPIAHVNLGLLYDQRGEWTRAEAEYRRALALDPDTPKAHNNIGVVYTRRRDYAAAREWFERELARYPGNAEAVFNLGVLEKVEGHLAAAVPLWERTLELNPLYVSAYEQLAEYYEGVGEAARAARYRDDARRVRARGAPARR